MPALEEVLSWNSYSSADMQNTAAYEGQHGWAWILMCSQAFEPTHNFGLPMSRASYGASQTSQGLGSLVHLMAWCAPGRQQCSWHVGSTWAVVLAKLIWEACLQLGVESSIG